MGVATGGQWSQGESQLHINCLEFLAGAFAIHTSARSKAQIKFRLVMGGTKSPVLARLAIDLWEWCLQQKIHVKVQYLPGVLNIRADRESRVMLDLHDWKLDPLVFAELNQLCGPLEVDLFASRLSTKLPRFYSWRPDPQAEAVDAFSQGIRISPFCTHRQVPQTDSRSTGFLSSSSSTCVASSALVPLAPRNVAPPVLLPQYPGLVTRLGEVHPFSNLQLGGWLLSSNLTLRREFQKGLKTSWLQPGGRGPHPPIHRLGESGIAGAVNRKLIQFMPQ